MLDSTATVVGITVMILALALVGGLVSLVALLPPIRRLGRRNKAWRAATVLVIGITACLISFGLVTRLGAEVAYIFSTVGTLPWERAEDPLKAAIVEEMWIRSLVPPLLQRPCYARDAEICQKADRGRGAERYSWGSYLASLGLSLISSITGGCMAWAFFIMGRKRYEEQGRGSAA